MNIVFEVEQGVPLLKESSMSFQKRIQAGTVLDTQRLVTIHSEQISIPDARWLVHLQFRRFAGCPVCDLHLNSMVKRHREIVSTGIREVVVFHSTVQQLLRYAADLPFAVIADPEKQLYRVYGVESGPRALLDPRAWPAVVRGVIGSTGRIVRGRQPIPPVVPEGGSLGLPADFLIASDGRVLACQYGDHAFDQWSIDELLTLARMPAELSGRSRSARPARI